MSHVSDRADGRALWYKSEQGETQRRWPSKEFFRFFGFQRFKELATKRVETEAMDLPPDWFSVIEHFLTMSATLCDVKEGFEDHQEVLGNKPPDKLSKKLLLFQGDRDWHVLVDASRLFQPFAASDLDPCHQLAEAKCFRSTETNEFGKIPKKRRFVFRGSPQFFWDNFVADTLQKAHNL